MQKKSRRQVSCALLLALIVSGFSACASQQASDTPPELTESEAALLDNAEVATPVSDEAPNVFADLQPSTEVMNNLEVSGDGLNTESGESQAAAEETPAASEEAPVADTAASLQDSSDPFYNPIGGESLGRVAYVLYGSRKEAKALLEQNPSLQDVKKLGSDQKVFFSFDRVRPQPTMLSKDLIDRYPAQLAERLAFATEKEAKTTVALGQGETLQTLSQRLYGTTRYWTEIYLLNQAAIPNYDRVKAGTELTVVQRAPVNTVAQAEAKAAAPVQKETPAAAPKVVEPKHEAPVTPPAPVVKPVEVPAAAAPAPAPEPTPAPAPVAEAVPAPVVDPIPETPAPIVEPVQEPVPFTPAQPEVQAPAGETGAAMGAASFFSNSANVRRMIYVAAILLIGIAAFFLTRSSKKKGFDMLDVTTNTMGPRPSFRKDNDKTNAG